VPLFALDDLKGRYQLGAEWNIATSQRPQDFGDIRARQARMTEPPRSSIQIAQ
jgi:hypothetical protein